MTEAGMAGREAQNGDSWKEPEGETEGGEISLERP